MIVQSIATPARCESDTKINVAIGDDDGTQDSRQNAQRDQQILQRQRWQTEMAIFDKLAYCFFLNYVLKAMERLFGLTDSVITSLLIELVTLDDIARTCCLVVCHRARRTFAPQLRQLA